MITRGEFLRICVWLPRQRNWSQKGPVGGWHGGRLDDKLYGALGGHWDGRLGFCWGGWYDCCGEYHSTCWEWYHNSDCGGVVVAAVEVCGKCGDYDCSSHWCGCSGGCTYLCDDTDGSSGVVLDDIMPLETWSWSSMSLIVKLCAGCHWGQCDCGCWLVRCS